MIVLGIDPGTAITGYGLVTETPQGELVALAYGAVITPSDAPMPERLRLLHEQLNHIILLHHPQSVAVEKLFFSRNVTTAIAVGQARGVVLLAAALNSLPLAEYTPMEVKQAVCGYGGADKAQVQEMVRVLLELEVIPRPDDAADALAIAICHLNHARFNASISA